MKKKITIQWRTDEWTALIVHQPDSGAKAPVRMLGIADCRFRARKAPRKRKTVSFVLSGGRNSARANWR
ncbi:MAG: hypothetical protein ACTHMT_14275 [Verrucomicrobiota bacterium]